MEDTNGARDRGIIFIRASSIQIGTAATFAFAVDLDMPINDQAYPLT